MEIRKISLFLVVCMFLPTVCFAKMFGEDAPYVLSDMYANPQNYIGYGGMSTGYTFLIDKNSIEVHEYNPPHYIIAAKKVTHHFSGMHRPEGSDESTSVETIRYKYNYSARTMYEEIKEKTGNVYWKVIDPAQSKSYHDDNRIAAGEILFYLAYNMSFYDKPIAAKQYINEGRSRLPLTQLSNGGDSSVHHVYNHRTNQIEWWKPIKNPKTGHYELTRVK